MVLAEGNVAVAFGLTIAAGSASMLGASVVFFPKVIRLISRRMLATSLGVSAGVMLYFSLVDLFHLSVVGWEHSGMTEDKAYQFATLCVFGGILAMKIVEVIVHKLGGDNGPNRQEVDEDIQITWNENNGTCEATSANKYDNWVPHSVGVGSDPVGELTHWHELAEKATKKKDQVEASVGTQANESVSVDMDEEAGGISHSSDDDTETKKANISSDTKQEPHTIKVVTTQTDVFGDEKGLFRAPATAQVSASESKKRLLKMSLSTATAIAIHNFPEGLATFAAAVQDPAAGVVFAIAVGVHNIPEGLCVALPIYFATGSKWKAFMWASLATISEIVAALLAWVFLVNIVTHESWAILFGIVTGMLLYLTIKELIPTAHRYDPEDSLVTSSIIVGMGLMAIALVVFGFEAAEQVLR